MTEGLKELRRLAYENACRRCQYHKDGECHNDKSECVWKTIEKELKAFNAIKGHAGEIKHFKYLLYMAKYWEENKTKVTEELLYNYDFPYTVDEFNMLKEELKCTTNTK